MTDRTKFEAMLEALINEDHESAKDIFHNIVVAKSREIYEQLLAEEFESDDEDEPTFGDDEDADDFGDDDSASDEDDSDDSEEGDEEDDDMFGGDDDSFGDEEDGDIEDRVMDLEDALDELKSEFEQLLAGEEDEPEHADMFGSDEEEDNMFGDEEESAAPMFGKEENEFQSMFEYVNKVALPKHGHDGDNNTSLFNKAKYNDMGGVAPKFGGTATGEGTGKGLLKPTTTKMDGGNQNVPGNAKAPKLQKVAAGHGTERKGTSEKAANTKSLIPGRK
jgi:hypothetical protein